MKYLKKFNESTESNNFDIDFAIVKISSKYTENEVASMIDEEILNWVDPDWDSDGSESEYDWYKEYCNGEAEDVVVTDIMNWYIKEFGKISDDNYLKLDEKIRDFYMM